MIGSLKGKILTKRAEGLLVDVGGVGYQVTLPLNTLSALPEEGQNVFLHIHTHVREDTLQLYGFASESEKKVFVTLLGISGVGPKMALNIMSGISYDEFIGAIEREDVAMLCRVPGLGKKTAHRLILELREKLPSASGVRDKSYEDALSALVNLGYKRASAQEYLDNTYNKGVRDIEELIRETLKGLTGSG